MPIFDRKPTSFDKTVLDMDLDGVLPAILIDSSFTFDLVQKYRPKPLSNRDKRAFIRSLLNYALTSPTSIEMLAWNKSSMPRRIKEPTL